MGQEQSLPGGVPPGSAQSSTSFRHGPQATSTARRPASTSSSAVAGRPSAAGQNVPIRGRRRPLTSLYTSEAVPNHDHVYAHAARQQHPYFRPPNQTSQAPTEPIGGESSRALQPQEPRNKVFKLAMSIDPNDGRISGNLVIGDGPRIRDVNQLQAICGGCNASVPHSMVNGPSDHRSNEREIAEFNKMYDRENLRLLMKINRDLMREVGDMDYQVTGMAQERKIVQEEIFQRMQMKDLFAGIRGYVTSGMILYGPSGNGKTVMAKLIAKHIHSRYINVEPYYLDSRTAYQDLIAIFRLAAQTAQNGRSVIVFDNIDKMFHNKNMLAQVFASEFQRSKSEKDQILVIGTMTSCYHNLPKKILDCFEYRIHVGVPDEKEREELVRAHMSKISHRLSAANLKEIAVATNYFTRGQIETLCRKVASIPAMEISSEYARAMVHRGHMTPPNIRSVTLADFYNVLGTQQRVIPGSPESRELCPPQYGHDEDTMDMSSSNESSQMSPFDGQDDYPSPIHEPQDSIRH